jgi:hypothetical protein
MDELRHSPPREGRAAPFIEIQLLRFVESKARDIVG